MNLLKRLLLLAALFIRCYGAAGEGYSAILKVEENEVDLVKGESTVILFTISGNLTTSALLQLRMTGDTAVLEPFAQTNYTVEPFQGELSHNVTLETIKEGKLTLYVDTESAELDVSEAFVVLSVMKDPAIETAAMVLGWISTIAWDVSFLPQIWHNFRRNSVAGLSFDFLTFNLIGFSFYLMFNIGMYWIPGIKAEFKLRHPNEINHVRLNDVIFPLYAVICTLVTIVQCIFYPKLEGQKVSWPCRIISALLILLVLIACILVPTVEKVLWIDVLYLMSYVKLFISMIKYTPQLYTNYKHKSTAGWSIFQVILDFSGGVCSLIQMFMLADNYDDINSVLSDPTKLGLGLLSIFFNIFFFIQHYWLYK
ncbi:cystinosin homolog isoform X2 [Hyalella azteca]|nr:cystinosin homolog isoform X2 [Hyalella azteca]